MRRRAHSGIWVAAAARPLAPLLAAVVLAACVAIDDGAIVVPDTAAADGSAPAATSLPSSTTSPSDGVPSNATVAVGDRIYRFTATCHELGAGDLVVLGVAEDPESDRLVEMYLQAFLADPYIGLRLGDGRLVEAALDAPLDLYVQDDVIRASSVRFVHSLDLETGEGEAVGLGKLEVFCFDYSDELPAPRS